MISNLLKITLSTLALAIAAAPAVWAEDKPEHKHTPLENQMDAMSKAWRALRKQAADASKNESSIELVAKIKAASVESLKLTPALAAEKPESERAAFVAGYQKSMKELIAELDNLSAAFKAGKNDEAGALIKKIGEMQKAGHKEFKKPE